MKGEFGGLFIMYIYFHLEFYVVGCTPCEGGSLVVRAEAYVHHSCISGIVLNGDRFKRRLQLLIQVMAVINILYYLLRHSYFGFEGAMTSPEFSF